MTNNPDVVEVTQSLSWHQKIWQSRYTRYGTAGRSKKQERRTPNPEPANNAVAVRETPIIAGNDIARFRDHIEEGSDCWLWTGTVTGNKTHKYGDFYVSGRSHRAHRIAYALEHGGVPHGMVIDHLCRNTLCVNPSHLEAVTSGDNTRRGASYPTHCKYGHELSGDNILMNGGKRRCRSCGRERTRKWRAKKNG